eukprot:TRINITY_DN345_c0_g1_i1.p2 TRINITY_DN345_c0_g1~~TRINITY_DN345_c0_g1_i1.p2  ORF type:complete len:114 (-),score=14.38 TRINITY_DN345_c0_g1_i1:756-1097(-)
MTGSGVSGIIVGILRVVTKLSLSDDFEGKKKSAMIYFALGGFSMIFCVVGYWLLTKLEFSRVILQKQEEKRVEETTVSPFPCLTQLRLLCWRTFCLFCKTLCTSPLTSFVDRR